MRICHSLAIVLALAVLPILLIPGSVALAAAPQSAFGGSLVAKESNDYRIGVQAQSSEGTWPLSPDEPVSPSDLERFLPYPPFDWEAYEPDSGTYHEDDQDLSWSETKADYYNVITADSASVGIWDTAFNEDLPRLQGLNALIEATVNEGYGWGTSVAGFPAWELEAFEDPYTHALVVLLQDRFVVVTGATTVDSVYELSDLIDYDGIATLAGMPFRPSPDDDWPIGLGVVAFVLCVTFFGARRVRSWRGHRQLEKGQLDEQNARRQARIEKEKAEIIDMIEDRLKRDGGHDR